MILHPRNLTRSRIFFAGWALCLAFGLLSGSAKAESVILHLKGGDQISGVLLSQNKDQIVISNAWVKSLTIPLKEIAKREVVPPPKTAPKAKVAKSSPPPKVHKKPQPKPAKLVKSTKPPQKTTAKPSIPKPAPPRGKWHGQANIGLDALFDTRNQQDYFGKFQVTYSRAYASNPKKFFRNTSKVNGEYQKTDGQESANHVRGSNKSDFDIGDRSYGYLSLSAGYDDIQKINFEYEVGPGWGMHVWRTHKFVLDLEGGLDYRAQYRRDTSNLESFYLRLAQDLTWHIRRRLTFNQNLSFYSDLERASQYRFNFESTLSYGFWENLTLNLTGSDRYNTEVAPGVHRNRLEFRLTLGVTF